MTEPAADPSAPAPTQSVADTSTSAEPKPIVARAGSYYRSRRYIMVVALFAGAIWFAYDGWVKYPNKNVRIAEVTKEMNETKDEARKSELAEESRKLGAPTSDFDIFLQKLFAIALPILALGYLGFFLHRSRGQIVLDRDVLTAPGHPAVNINEIRSIDNRRWKKKGIAQLTYASGGTERTLTLDDFIYDQTPIDDIYAVIAKRHGLTDAAPGQHVISSGPQVA